MQRKDMMTVKIPPLIWRQTNKFRMNWDLLIIVLALYNCIMIPLGLAFSKDINDSQTINIIERIVDVFFLLDIVLNFRTTYINPKTNIEIIEPMKVAKNYMSSIRFPVDVLASIPFDLFITVDQNDEDTQFQIRLLGIAKLIRLLRLGRIITYMRVNASLKIGIRIFQLLMVLIVLIHWLSCIWFLLVSEGERKWIPTKDMDAYKTDFFEKDVWTQYSIVYYYAILLILGNDIAPVTTLEMAFGVSVMILGAIVTAFIFGTMASLMALINKKDSNYQEQLDMVSQTMRSLKLPEKVQDNVLKYLQFINETPGVHQDMQRFLELLSPTLRKQILSHIHKNVIEGIDILRNCSRIERDFIVANLQTVLFLQDDIIIRQGEDSNCLYFINRGKVAVKILEQTVDKDI